MIYFIHFPKAVLIKIGTTENLKRRMSYLNSSSGAGKGILLHTMPGSYDEEGAILGRFAHLCRGGEYFFPAKEIYDFIGHPGLHRMPTMKHLGGFSEMKRAELHYVMRRSIDGHEAVRAKDELVRFERAMEGETRPGTIPIVLRFAVAWNDHSSRFANARWLDPYYRARKRFKRAWIAARDDADATRRYLARQARLKRRAP